MWRNLNFLFPRMLYMTSLVENGPVVLEKKILWLSNLNPLHPRMFCAKTGQIGPVVRKKKMKIRKVYRQKDRQTDGRTKDNLSVKLTKFESTKIESCYCYLRVQFLSIWSFHLKDHCLKTWWKNKKTRKIKILLIVWPICVLICFKSYTNKYECSKLNTYLVKLFLSEWGYCVYIEIPLKLSSPPPLTFRAL